MRERHPQSCIVRGAAAAFLTSTVFLIAWTGAAQADPGEASDPRDISGALDVEKVSHSHDEEYVTYRVDTYDGFDNERDFYQMRWDFDLDGDTDPDDACILLESAGEGDVLRAALYPGCGQEISATTNASKPGGRTVEVRFSLRDVVHGAALTPGERFGYRVTAMDLKGNKDTIPDQGLVAQDGLPVPPKATDVPQVQPAQQGAGVPVGEGGRSDGVPPGEGGESTSEEAPAANDASDNFLPIGVSSSPLTWVLAIGLPGLALVVVLVIRRRRLEGSVGADELGPLNVHETPDEQPGRRELQHVPDVAREASAYDAAWSWAASTPSTTAPRLRAAAEMRPESSAETVLEGWLDPRRAPAPPAPVHDSDT